MSTPMEITERQKFYLHALLTLKKENAGITIAGLDRLIENAVVVMNQDDVAWVEKVTGVKTL